MPLSAKPPVINKTVMMSGAQYFGDQFAINAYMNSKVKVDIAKAMFEHETIKQSLVKAGVKVVSVPPPASSQDGVYTANWGLCRGDKAIIARLPNKRQIEEDYAEAILKEQGKTTYRLPLDIRFSGQGDALPCGNKLFVGSTYRTDKSAYTFLKDLLGYQIIGLETLPKRAFGNFGPKIKNKVTGWLDSYFYDLDLALAVISPDTIAYCPEAFTPNSRQALAELDINKITVNRYEAIHGFACNLVSTGSVVIMSDKAPKLQQQLDDMGYLTITPSVNELGKGGGYIRCTTLTLDNA